MLNLSQLGRQHPEYPIWRKINSLRHPDQYLAENMADFKKNAPNLELSWLVGFPLSDRILGKHAWHAYITVNNVGIKLLDKLEKTKAEEPYAFLVHDSTDEGIMFWYDSKGFFPSLKSFEETQIEQGLHEEDWVYDVFFRYLIKEDLAYIIEVRKYPPIMKAETERESLLDIIRNLSPAYQPSI